MAKIKVLKEHPLFRDFTDREIALVSQVIGEKTVAKETALYLEGTPGDSLILVRSGTIELRRHGPMGDEVLGRLGAGEVLGGLSLVGPGPRPCTAWTVEPVEVLTLAAEDFQVLLGREPTASAKLVMALVRDLSLHLREEVALLARGARGLA